MEWNRRMTKKLNNKLLFLMRCQALSIDSRLDLLLLLLEHGPLNGNTLAGFAESSPSNCSHHLKELVRVHLVSEVRSGQSKLFAANCGGIQEILDELKGMLGQQSLRC